MDDLQTMKEQLHKLQEALNNQTIVTDRLIRETMNRKVRSLNTQATIQIAIAIVAIPYCTIVLRMIELSWIFCLATDCIFVFEICYIGYSHKPLSARYIASSSMADLGRKLVRLKRRNTRKLRVGIPGVCIWLLWFAYEITHNVIMDAETRNSILFCSLVGAVIGFSIGLCLYRRQQRIASELLAQIEKN